MNLLPLAVLMTSFTAAMVIFLLPEARHRLRSLINIAAACLKLVLVIFLIQAVLQQDYPEFSWEILPGLSLVLRADALAMLFAGLSSLLWLFTTLYAIGYLENAPNRSRFFGFFSLCVASTMGIALAGNLLTFLIFYELLTLSTYPLVVHRGTPESLRAGRTYLIYTLAGGVLLLLGVALLYAEVGELNFGDTAALAEAFHAHPGRMSGIFFLLLVGLGVKAAIFPLHAWLPTAMVAPAPVSALLHAVAVVKAGAFGIIRLVYDVYGIELSAQQGLLLPLTLIAAFTILYGSWRALQQIDIKKRLAFSTVSQVSYILLGISLFGPLGTLGGLVHLLHQGLMKVTLFFCAGNYAETLGIHKIHELNGVGQRMPLTSAAFTLGALGMIGLPPIAGFISKWYLGLGALQAGMPWVLGVLIASSLLNAAYFLPVLKRIWFSDPPAAWPQQASESKRLWRDSSPWLLLPTLVTATLSLAAGLFAAASWSPLSWAELIVIREYLP
ncbi:complex I subunit 5 family protein [Nitrincola tapanii]|uniref:Monovalent cation/H+ antiporter subunit D family protein n=1 Tax=Nitrincola tapanii TaxID=1708751 RepID=A0A5A9W713_9GAMM|nr:proton-conducting transporter membrane subunit [Nitrincola tapanii]KAA0876516.1 monovalent cation/H+ antiporter subunit D family protein [Nitrincola tapanii]